MKVLFCLALVAILVHDVSAIRNPLPTHVTATAAPAATKPPVPVATAAPKKFVEPIYDYGLAPADKEQPAFTAQAPNVTPDPKAKKVEPEYDVTPVQHNKLPSSMKHSDALQPNCNYKACTPEAKDSGHEVTVTNGNATPKPTAPTAPPAQATPAPSGVPQGTPQATAAATPKPTAAATTKPTNAPVPP